LMFKNAAYDVEVFSGMPQYESLSPSGE